MPVDKQSCVTGPGPLKDLSHQGNCMVAEGHSSLAGRPAERCTLRAMRSIKSTWRRMITCISVRATLQDVQKCVGTGGMLATCCVIRY